MKKIFATILLLVACTMFSFGAFTYTTTTFTQVGTTGVWYIALNNTSGTVLGWRKYTSSPGKEIVIDIDYTKGDETSINFTYGFAYKTSYATAPVAADYSYVSTGVAAVAKDTRTITGSSRFSFIVAVPDRASHLFISWGNTGGTPTGTIAWAGYVSRYIGVTSGK
jgi:hypothetical protein